MSENDKRKCLSISIDFGNLSYERYFNLYTDMNANNNNRDIYSKGGSMECLVLECILEFSCVPSCEHGPIGGGGRRGKV